MNPFDKLEKSYPDVIAQMDKQFDSHEFILKLAHQHQSPYVKALAKYADKSNPFWIVHRELAKRLNKFGHLIHQTGDGFSPNIFGEPKQVKVWEKK